MAEYPWGESKTKSQRNVWLRQHGLQDAFRAYRKQSRDDGLADAEADTQACLMITEDFQELPSKETTDAPVKEDWYWAFKHYGDDREKEEMLREKAPSPFAWSLLVGAWANDTSWKALQDRVAKDLFGGIADDDDDRAFIATGMPSALRERFSGVLGKAKRLFAGQLPEVFGRTEGS